MHFRPSLRVQIPNLVRGNANPAQNCLRDIFIPHLYLGILCHLRFLYCVAAAECHDVVLRPDLFAKLDTLLPTTPEYHSAALWGLGGSGKTQIALEYAHRRCDDPACSVFWAHADNETTFVQDYKIVARKLGLDSKLNGEELLAAVRDRIEAEPRWVLILDNVDDLALFASLFHYIPRGPTGTVLWTSRDERIAGTLVGPRRGVRVAQMTIDEATRLLETARNEKTDIKELDDASVLLAELHWLPLAISQAGAYMRRTSTPIREYLLRLAEGKERWRVLKETEFDRYRRAEVPNSILETWSISIEQIRQENEMAYKVLHILAYLDNRDIPFEVIAAAAKFGTKRPNGGLSTDEQQVDRAIVRLKEFSFLGTRRTEADERSFEMHKLVQEAARYGLTTKRLLERKTTKLKLRLWGVMRVSFGKQREAERGSWEDGDDVYFSNAALQYLRHAAQACDWAETCGKEVEASSLLTRLSGYLFDRGSWREKEAVDRRALGIRREALGEKHPHTVWSMANLAMTYHAQGRYEEAEEISVKVLALQQEVLGNKHPDTMWSMAELAMTYLRQGRYKKAEGIYVEVLALQQEVLGNKHPHTMWSMASLAGTYLQQRRYEEAEEISVKVLALQKEVLGNKHPDTMWSMAELATTYREQGRYEEAEEIQIKVLALKQEVLGDKHPHTMWSMSELALTYREQGRYEEAEEIQIKVLALRQEVLGQKHPDTLRAMHDLALTWRSRGRGDEAITLMKECSQWRHKILGPHHPFTKKTDGVLDQWRTE
ncbi:hypothetical protein EDB81DRAFT_848304 [Dactylonectria macrodidyma]|uniref:NB-ARC domain-containing protein n=1 Tax=Dactylonectria macrodidyma TaxID=307937 RepID=A0A9P9DEI1_9HYPO|nr:hypothetical protein EDB81DRAFT_848304 [Dactylonectria macrodidyma]